MLKQICIIPFTRNFLIKFNNLAETPLEAIESVDMLRVIEHGFKVKIVLTQFEVKAVDTEADLNIVSSLIKNDPLVASYTSP